MTRPAAFAAALLLAAACTPAVPLSRDEGARLAAAPEVPVLWVRAAPPWVDCQAEEGQKVWEYPGSGWNGEAAPPTRLASAGRSPVVLGAGNIWQAIQDQWTEPLQTPPVDPASVTARHLVARAREAGIGLPLAAPREISRRELSALERQAGAAPFLLVETPRFVLAGCFFTYQPWFEARAAILEPGTGRTLWRDTCAGTFPDPAWPPPSTRDELLAGDGALYARILEQRAADCAGWLVARLAAGRGT
jgi:hypothetical protein